MILLLGHAGYVGNEFRQQLESQTIPHRCVSRSQHDYTNRDTLIGLLKETRATFLINAVGYTGKPNVDA
ncbi:MAG: sugar nucleotide-binding protein [Rhodopirellula sp. JB053]